MPPLVEKFSKDMEDVYKDRRNKLQKEQWPPYQPTSVVNVTVIHYKNKQMQQKLIEISDHFKTGASGISKLVSSPPSHCIVTKDINEIFRADPADQTEEDTEDKPPKLILIEGAPGIGKTVLAREIAYLWADHKLLTDCKLVILVYLRDPRVHIMKSIEELVQLYTSKNVATEVIDYLEKCSGQNVAFVFDGFDEFPASQEGSIVTDIIGNEHGRKFCRSIVVVTSRPSATLNLCKIVDRRIEILGFAPEERDKVISLSFSQFSNKRIELEKYFDQYPIISSLCYIPLNLAILLYLFHQGNLPETLTEMNESFVIHTIYRHMEKVKSHLPGCINHLKDLPEYMRKILHKLSKLAFEGLCNNQIMFTYEKVKDMCPEVYEGSEAANGFSLLQAVEHYPQKGVGTTTSFNFLHFTMQEYLAAYYVSTLPEEFQLVGLQTAFWSGYFSFMWIMYVGIVGAKSGAFSSFVKTELQNMFYDKVKCLQLFQCYTEARIDVEMPRVVSFIFSNGNVCLTGITLLSHHVTSLLYFMSASGQQWKSLELDNCNLQRTEMYDILQSAISNKEKMSTLNFVDLSSNGSSPWGVYCVIIRNCCGESLTLCGDKGMEQYITEITDSLQTNTTLNSLTLFSIGKIGVESIKVILMNNISIKNLNLSWKKLKDKDIGNLKMHTRFPLTTDKTMQAGTAKDGNRIIVDVTILFDVKFSYSLNVRTKNHEPKCINLQYQCLNADAAHVVAFGLCNNTTVEQLNISNERITDDGATAIIDCLKHNKVLKNLNLSNNRISINGMNMMLENIENQGTTLPLEFVDLSKNQTPSWAVYCAIIKRCCRNNLTLYGDEGIKEYILDILDSLEVNTTLQSLALCNINSCDLELCKNALKYFHLSQRIARSKKLFYISPDTFEYKSGRFKIIVLYESSPKTMDLCSLNICDDVVHFIEYCTKLERLNISHNNITDNGMGAICECLKHNLTLKELDLSHNNICFNGMNKISIDIESQRTPWLFENVDLSRNDSSPWGVYCAIIRHCCGSSLTLCGDEGMQEYIKEITDSLQANSTLQSLTLHSIGKIGVESVKEVLMNDITIKRLKLSWQKSKRRENILMKTLFSHNGNDVLQSKMIVDSTSTVLILYDNDDGTHSQSIFSSSDIISMPNFEPKIVINLSDKKLTADAAHLLAFGLCNNTTVEEFIASNSGVGDEGALAIIDCLKYNKTLKKLDLSHNSISINGMNKMLENIENQGTTLSLEYVNMSNCFIPTYNNIILRHNKSSSPWGVYCAIIKSCCVNSLTLCGDKGMKEYIKEITDSLHANTTLQSITLLGVGKIGVDSIKEVLINNLFLKNIKLSWEKSNSRHRKKALMHRCYPSSDDATQDKTNITASVTNIIVNINILCDDDTSHSQLLSLSSDIDCTQAYESKTVIKLSRKTIDDDAAHVLAFGLCNNTTLEELNVSCNCITAKGAIAIIDGLEHNKTLKILDLSHNKIDNDGMNKISESIGNQGTTSLEYVDLSGNYTLNSSIRGITESSSLWGVYCTIIRQCCVNRLTLCGDKGMKEYVKEITDSLQTKTTLESLTLLSMGEIGVQSIKAVLMNNIGIKTLNLSWKKINSNDLEGKSVHTLFSFNTNDIMHNKMTEYDTNGVVIIRILYEDDDDDVSHNQLLPSSSDIACGENFEPKSVINLSGKQIHDNAVHVLAFGLYNNTAVEELNISNNKITEEGALVIIDCLKQNRALQKLDLSYNCIGKMINYKKMNMNKMLQSIENEETTLSLKYIDLSKNSSSPWGVYCAIIRHCRVNSLTLCGDEGMKDYIKEILDSLQINVTLQSLTLRDIGEYELQLFESAVSSLNESLTRGKRENCGKFRYFSLGVSYCSKSTILVNIDIHIR